MFHLLPVISNKLDGGMLNQITKCVAEKFIKQGKPSMSASFRNLADNSESEKFYNGQAEEIKVAEFNDFVLRSVDNQQFIHQTFKKKN